MIKGEQAREKIACSSCLGGTFEYEMGITQYNFAIFRLLHRQSEHSLSRPCETAELPAMLFQSLAMLPGTIRYNIWWQRLFFNLKKGDAVEHKAELESLDKGREQMQAQ